MQFTLSPYIAIPIIVIASLASLALWRIFVRPVEPLSGTGTITARVFQEAQTIEKTVIRTFRNVEHSPRHSTYTLPDRFVYRVRIDGLATQGSFTLPAIQGQQLDVGQRVRVTYSRRSIPLIWTKIFVEKADPL